MKNLWLFISKYNAFFLFILFFGISCYLVVTNNTFQRSSTLNSSNTIVGGAYERINAWRAYLHLGEANQVLAEENAELRKQVELLTYRAMARTDTVQVTDTLGQIRYAYIVARVVNNSVNQKNNYITINKGSAHGITKDMAVFSPDGVVGIVVQVSNNYATIQSLLHRNSRVSASLEHSQVFGSLMWGDNYDARKSVLMEIPNHVEVKEGEEVFTSGYSSLFPPGVKIGKVAHVGPGDGQSFLDIDVDLYTNFHNLQWVYVVLDHHKAEKDELDALKENN